MKIALWSLFLITGLFCILLNNELIFVLFPIANLIINSILINRDSTIKKQLINRLFFVSLAVWLFSVFTGAFLQVQGRLFGITACYFYVFLYFLKFKKEELPRQYIFFIVAAPFILSITLIVAFLKDTIDSFTPLGYSIAFSALLASIAILWKRRTLAVAILGTFLIAGMSFVAYPNYASWIEGNKSAASDDRVNLPMLTEQADTISVSSLKGKIVVLDFWYSGCGVCFKKFPELQNLFVKYSKDTAVFIAAVNIPVDETDRLTDAFDLIKSYRFIKLKSIYNMESNRWRIPWYPYIMVFDRDRRLRYSGALNEGEEVYINNIHKIIKELKME